MPSQSSPVILRFGRDFTWSMLACLAAVLAMPRLAAGDDVEVEQMFPSGGFVSGHCFYGGLLYGASVDNILREYDPETGEILHTIPELIPDLEVAHLHGMTRGANGTFWVVEMQSRLFYRFQFGTFELIETLRMPPDFDPFGIAFDGELLWTGAHSSQQSAILGLDPATGDVMVTLQPGVIDVHGLVWVGGYLWALDNASNTVYKLDRQGVVYEVFQLPTDWWDELDFDGHAFWTTDPLAFFTVGLPPQPPLGDANLDGLVDGDDIAAFEVILADPEQAEPPAFYAADVNQDWQVNAEDAALFAEILINGQ